MWYNAFITAATGGIIVESNTVSRNTAREQAFMLVFEQEFNKEVPLAELVDFASESELFDADDFAVKSAALVSQRVDELDGIIASNLKGWTLARISKVSLAILRLAICEMKYFDDIDAAVSINSAVELAKKFGSDRDPKFVNGLLSSVLKAQNDA